MSSAELLELERIPADFGQIVFLTEQQFDKLQRGRLVFVDRETSKPLVIAHVSVAFANAQVHVVGVKSNAASRKDQPNRYGSIADAALRRPLGSDRIWHDSERIASGG